MTTRIGFTGHRDKFASLSTLNGIGNAVGGAGYVWVHGGAIGFDTQIERYARAHNIPTDVIKPEYGKYSAKIAPIFRNMEIVDSVEEIFALWDGRKTGGTYMTIEYAKKKNKKVTIIPVG